MVRLDRLSRISTRERLCEAIIANARAALAQQRSDGSLSAGHNGPYRDPETPVRNTAHWSITFLTAWKQTGDASFKDAAANAAAYLLSPAARPADAAFHCRSNPRKDETNGLIGQAWAIEALVELGMALDRPNFIEEGTRVFFMHPYDYNQGGWRRVTLAGQPIDFDRTFNHQLWFSAAGALLASAGVDGAAARVLHFVSQLGRHMKLYQSGLIRHVSARFLGRTGGPGRILYRGVRNTLRARHLYTKAIGYHAFNTYALALIQRALPDLNLPEQKPVAAALTYLMSDAYRAAVATNPYGFPYNPPGFEAAVTIDTFLPDRQDAADAWLERQLDEGQACRTRASALPVPDPTTLAARLYEACRLLPPVENTSRL